MNSNKTVIPGIQGQTQPQYPQGIQPSPIPSAIPPMGAPMAGQETVIPGMSSITPGLERKKTNGQIFGFLFSVSRTMAGEFWPLLLGANTIGRGPGNSIQLEEMTVSDVHADIHVISRSNQLTVYIKDDVSKTGTLLNGKLVRGEADLNNGDIITIGENYELFVVLINARELGLEVKSSFTPIPASPVAVGGTAPFGQLPGGVYRPQMSPATVAEGQSGPIPVGGHTVIMGGNTR